MVPYLVTAERDRLCPMMEFDMTSGFGDLSAPADILDNNDILDATGTNSKREKRNVKKSSVSKYELISETAPNILNTNKVRKRPKSSLKMKGLIAGKAGFYLGGDYWAPQKRPRGRPPLAQKIPAIFAPSNSNHNSHLQTVSYNIKSEYGYGNSISNGSNLLHNKSHRDHSPRDHIGSSSAHSSRSHTDGANTESANRANRPNASAVTQRLLARLMTEEPMDITELLRGMTDIPKDIVQACLDVLLVLGLVMKVVDNSDSTGNNIMYTIVFHVKVPEAIDIRNVKNEITKKEQSIDYLQERVARLIALTNKPNLSAKERKAELLKMSSGGELRYFH